MSWHARAPIIVLAAFLHANGAGADIATGDANVARGTTSGIKANPANAARIDRTTISYKADFFGWKRRQIKFPGQKLYKDDGLGFKAPLDIPQIAFKLSPSFGIAGFLAPPLPITLPIDVEEVPIYVLGTVSYVDVHIKAKTTGYLDLNAGFEIADGFVLGAKINYLGFEAEGYATPTNSSDHLVDFKASGSTSTFGLGVVLELGDDFEIGVASDIVQSNQTDVTASVGGIGEIGGEEAGASDGAGGQSSLNPLASFSFGVGAKIGSSTKIYFDGRYSRSDPNKTSLSIVDLKEKPVDSYDKLGVSLGLNQKVGAANMIQAGFRYEPSAIGPGSPGEDGKVGYGGSFDQLITIARGSPFEPYYKIEAGFLSPFGRIKDRRRGKKRRAPRYKGEWGIGVSYLSGAAGIGPEGELPAAYEHTELSFPLSLKYRL